MSYVPRISILSKDFIQVELLSTILSVSDNGGNRCTFDNVFNSKGSLALNSGKVALLANSRYRVSIFSRTDVASGSQVYDFTNGVPLSPFWIVWDNNNNNGSSDIIVEPTSVISIGLSASISCNFVQLGPTMLIEEL